ncbi:outer membrane protein assembly factor BamA [Boseongicola sp. H5]|uniref:outer membrane protein assembly factor BamA n=1 Tax=Rhodobacterales TaxID=204455 RepID=UPI001D0AED7E|nr:outer membrane protein assembly factor BamA [Boseongicola sp. H5]
MSSRAENASIWRGAVAALLAVALVALLAWPVAAQNFRFSQFDVQGNQRIEASTILTYANINPGEAVSAGQVNDAQQRLQQSGLFESVEVVPRGSTLVIIVQEYPTINRISIEGNRRLNDDDLLPLLTSQPRRVYSPSVAEQDAAAINDAYRQAGRLTATVSPQIIRRSDNRVDLVFEVTEGRVVETERISFVGNREFSDRRLRRVLESTQAGLFRAIIRRDSFVADRIAFDQQLLTDFYRDRGYVDFEVLSVTSELARGRDAYFITFNIREGQSFDIGEITVVSDLPEIDIDEYRDVIRISSGNTYSPRLIDNTISRMENLATRQGLRFIRVEPRITRNDADLTLDVEFAVVRGERVFVERIDIEGNATTLDRVVRRQFDTVEGDPFDPRAIRQASERIRALAYFSDVQVEGRQGTSPDSVIVDVDVEEQPTGSLGFSVSFSSDVGTGLAVSFAEQNFLGRGQAVEFSFSTAQDSRAFNFGFVEPAFLRRDLSFGLDVFYSETNQENAAFDTENIGLRTSLGFPISEYGRMSVFYRISEDSILNVPTDSSPILQREEGSRVTSSLGYGFSYDTRNTGLNPNAGVLLRFNQELAGLGGDNEYIRTTALASAERGIAREEVTLRATIEGGALEMLDGNSRFTDRFFLSSRQMRGFEPRGLGPRDTNAVNNDALGGNYFAVARFEAAFPLGLPDEYGISGGVFYDIGTVWGLDDVVGAGGAIVDDDIHFRSSVGFSIFWDTAIGPLRFNFSRALETQPYDQTREFDLTIEARF